MKTLESLAQKIAVEAKTKDESFTIDPFTIAAIVSIIVSLIRLWMDCRDRNSAKSQLKKPGMMFKILLKREIKKHFKSLKDKTFIYDSFISVASTTTEAELINILKEIEEEKL
jgi:hypothetical protein